LPSCISGRRAEPGINLLAIRGQSPIKNPVGDRIANNGGVSQPRIRKARSTLRYTLKSGWTILEGEREGNHPYVWERDKTCA